MIVRVAQKAPTPACLYSVQGASIRMTIANCRFLQRLTSHILRPHPRCPVHANMIEMPVNSFRWFQENGLRALFDEISPIQSFNKDMEMYFLDYAFGQPKYSVQECRNRDATYAAPLKVNVRLLNKATGEVKEQDIFMGDFPLMTVNGTFVINGAERVVVSQLVRSPGAYFTAEPDPASGRMLCYGKLIPNRGAWLELRPPTRTSSLSRLTASARFRSQPCCAPSVLPRMMSCYLLSPMQTTSPSIPTSCAQWSASPKRCALGLQLRMKRALSSSSTGVYALATRQPKRTRASSAEPVLPPRRYDLGSVGRYKLNKRLALENPPSLSTFILTKEDMIRIVEICIRVNNGVEHLTISTSWESAYPSCR